MPDQTQVGGTDLAGGVFPEASQPNQNIVGGALGAVGGAIQKAYVTPQTADAAYDAEKSRVAQAGPVQAAANPQPQNWGGESNRPNFTVSTKSPAGRKDQPVGNTQSDTQDTSKAATPPGGLTTEQVNTQSRAQMDNMDAQANANAQSGRAQNAALDARQTASTGYTAAQDAARDAEFNDKTGDRLATRGHWGMTNRAVAATHADNVTAKQNLIAARAGYENAERGVGAAGQQNFVQNALAQQKTAQGQQGQNTASNLANQKIAGEQQTYNHDAFMQALAQKAASGDEASISHLNAYNQAVQGKEEPSLYQMLDLAGHAQAGATANGQPFDMLQHVQGMADAREMWKNGGKPTTQMLDRWEQQAIAGGAPPDKVKAMRQQLYGTQQQ